MATATMTELSGGSLAIWSRVLDPTRPTYSSETARAILELDFNPADQLRIVELSAKANEGTLTAAEREALENYVEINDVLAVLKSKARILLKGSAFAIGFDLASGDQGGKIASWVELPRAQGGITVQSQFGPLPPPDVPEIPDAHAR